MKFCSQPTACAIVPERSEWDTCVWAGVDKAWEQEKLEARKMLENAADRASEPQASIAQSKRIGACHPQRQVHALLGGSS
jgi:hypothetical protein